MFLLYGQFAGLTFFLAFFNKLLGYFLINPSPHNPLVGGSSPPGPTIINNHISEALEDISIPIAIFNAGDAPLKHNFDSVNQELLVTKGMLNVSHFLMMEQSTEFNELLESIFSEFKLILR